MKKEEQLHHLIHALTSAEKKYVRLNINKFRPDELSKNLLLFDALNKQKKYTADSTLQAYKTAGYPTNFLAADRHQLYDIVLDSLSDFHAKSTADIQISIGYQKAVLLFEKKLFQQTLKQIERVVKVAEQYESYGTLINLYHLKQRVLKLTNHFEEALEAIRIQHISWEAQYKVNQFIELHYESIQFRIELSKARSAESLQKLNDFIQHPLLKEGPPDTGFQVQFHYWETFCNYYFIQDDKQKELEANQALVALLDKYESFKKNEPLNYLIFNTRILAIQRNLYPEQFLENLATYRSLNIGFGKQKKEAESIIFIFSYNFELDYCIHHKNWDAGLVLIPDMLKGLKKYDRLIRASLKITAYYRIAYLYFFKQQYWDALEALEKVLEDFPTSLRPDVHSFALLLKIIIHYEVGNIRLMPYLIKTAQYHITKRNLMFQTEKIVIEYLKKLSRKSNEGLHQEIFEAFGLAIETVIQDNAYERRSLEIFDFITWINTRKNRK